MRTIRSNIFETNSSSTHSLVLTDCEGWYMNEFKENNDVFKNGIVRFSALGAAEFGPVCSFYDKVQYILGVLAGGLIMKETEEARKETGNLDYWKDYSSISTDWLENNLDIQWFLDIVKSVASQFGVVIKGFDFRSYRNMNPDDMYESKSAYCGGMKFKNGKNIYNPLDHECMEWYPRPKERIFGVHTIAEVLSDPNISIVYWRNG